MDKNNHALLFDLIGRVHVLKPKQLQQITNECEIRLTHKQQHIAETGKKNLNEYFLLDGIRYFTHAGGGGGYNIELRLYPGIATGSIIMFNRSGMSDERFLDKVDRYFISS